MTSIQKIIKYFSLAFAVFLIVSITYGVMMLLYFLATPPLPYTVSVIPLLSARHTDVGE